MKPQTFILIFFVLVLIFSTIVRNEAEAFEFLNPKTIQLTDEEVKICGEQGGCFVITHKAAEELFTVLTLLQRQAKGAKGKSCA